MSTSFVAGWLFMFVMILIVFGAIAAIIWRSWLIGSIVLVFVLLMVGTVYTFRSSHVATTPDTDVVREEFGTIEGRGPWDPAPEHLADVYPSVDEAAASLGTRLLDQIAQRHPTTRITYIKFTGDHVGSKDPIFTLLRDNYPDANLGSDDKAATDSSALTVTVSLQGTERNQTLRVTATSGNFRFVEAAGVQNKPWVSNLGAYADANPGHNFIVGKSSIPAASPEDARRQARRDATRQLAPLVIAGYPELSRNPPHGDQQWLSRYLDNQLELGRFNRKEFVQRLYLLNSGYNYRAAVLIDASTDQMRGVHAAIHNEYTRRNSRIHRLGGGVIGLGILICFLYLFLNRATRGYFQMNLRLAATMVLIAGVLLIMFIT